MQTEYQEANGKVDFIHEVKPALYTNIHAHSNKRILDILLTVLRRACIGCINIQMLFSLVLNPCDGILCANGGTCLNNCGVAQCICRPEWTGTLCIDCESHSAENK